MALSCNLFPLAHPNSFGYKTCTVERHRHPATDLSISAPFGHTERRSSTWALGRSVKTKAKKSTKLTTVEYRRREISCSAEVASGQGIQGAENGGAEGGAVPDFDISRLEAYTDRFRREVLCVNALLEDEEEDQVIVFKGFSSSLIRPTPDDPSEPVLPPTAVIQSIDRMRAPYNPSDPQFVEQGLSWQEFHRLLEEKGL
ncbi:unnamed protein product [Calypogeia fissa]